MNKYGFPLNPSNGWPPYDFEHLWLEKNDKYYRVKSFPFFVKGLAFDDIIKMSSDKDGYVDNWEIQKKSDNSTIWIISRNDSCIRNLEKIGCGVEGSPLENYYSINVPNSVDHQELSSILDEIDDDPEVEVAYPALRIDI